jgi:hypothetical protein
VHTALAEGLLVKSEDLLIEAGFVKSPEEESSPAA